MNESELKLKTLEESEENYTEILGLNPKVLDQQTAQGLALKFATCQYRYAALHRGICSELDGTDSCVFESRRWLEALLAAQQGNWRVISKALDDYGKEFIDSEDEEMGIAGHNLEIISSFLLNL